MTDDGPKELRPHGHVYGNFRVPRVLKVKERKIRGRSKHISSAKRREGNDEKHLAAIRLLPCCIPGCRRGPSDPHHLKGNVAAGQGERCFGRRATDQWVVPVCRMHHDIVQPVRGDDEHALFWDLGIGDVYDLARSLYQAPKIHATLVGIVLAHQEE